MPPLNSAAMKQYPEELRADVLAAAKVWIDSGKVSQATFSRAVNMPQPMVSNWRKAERAGLEYRNPPRAHQRQPRKRTDAIATLAADRAARAPARSPVPTVKAALEAKATAFATPAPAEPIAPKEMPPMPPTPPTTKPTTTPRRPNGKPTATVDTLHKAVRGLLDLNEMGVMDSDTVVASLRALMERIGE